MGQKMRGFAGVILGMVAAMTVAACGATFIGPNGETVET